MIDDQAELAYNLNMGGEITDKDRAMAQKCLDCKTCRRAGENQKGFSWWVVRLFGRACPDCLAYEKVYGKKAHSTRNI